MMLLPFSRSLCFLFGAMVFFTDVQAEAQIVHIRRGAGITVNAPGVHVHVGPVGAAAYAPVRRRFLARLGIVQQPPAFAPTQQSAAAPQQPIIRRPAVAPQNAPELAYDASGPILAAPANSEERPFPTEAELAALDDVMLLNALLDVSSRLNARLARLSTGTGWQRYLRLPEDALPPPTEDGAIKLGFQSIHKTLSRFDQVAANPEFAKITTLPSFVAKHSALHLVVKRFDILQPAIKPSAPASQVPAEQEILPTPEPASQNTAPVGERSILKR